MKNYTITVNGVAYDVTVEEAGAGSAPAHCAGTPSPETRPARRNSQAPCRRPPACPSSFLLKPARRAPYRFNHLVIIAESAFFFKHRRAFRADREPLH